MNLYAEYCDNRVQMGYGTMLLVKKPSDTKYSLLVPVENIPSVFGTPDNFEYDLLTCNSKGMVQGKDSIEPTDVEFMWHRDNVLRLEALQNKVLDFMVFYADYTARAFSGTLRVRPNESGADIQKGTFTIVPVFVNPDTIADARDLVQLTVAFVNVIPDKISFGTSTTITVPVQTQPFLTGLSATCNIGDVVLTVTSATGEVAGKVVITKGTGTTPQFGVVKVTGTTASYSEWTTTIAIDY